MNAKKSNDPQQQSSLSKGMKTALIASIIFHLCVIVAMTVGLPFISKEPKLPPQPISIELVDVAENVTINKKPQPKLAPPKEEPPKKANKMEAPPKVDAKEPPKIKPMEKPPEKKPDTVKPKPKVPPPPSEKLEEPKPPEKKEEEKEEAVQQEDPLASLMKNLQESETPSESEEDGKADPNFVPDAPMGETMTQSELSSLTYQLMGCWQIPIGAKEVNDMVVTLHIWPNADRTVMKVEIQDQWRMANDPAFRAVAESAKRAALDPQCSPLDIPMEKQEVWKGKYIAIDFDPRSVT